MLGFVPTVLGGELVFHIVQKGKGDTVFIKFVAHTKKTNPLFYNVVEHVLIVHHRLVSIFCGNSGQQNSGHGGKVARCYRKEERKERGEKRRHKETKNLVRMIR